MNFYVYNGTILGESKDGLSAGQLTSAQIFDYLEDCLDWNDECVFPLSNELCSRLNMDFDAYETYDDLVNEAYTRMMNLIKDVASADLTKDTSEGGLVMHLTIEEVTRRLKEHSEEQPGIPLWPEEYINAYNNKILEHIFEGREKIIPVRW